MSKFVILHKRKTPQIRLCCIMKVTKQTLQHLRKKVSLTNTIHHSTFIYNQFKKYIEPFINVQGNAMILSPL